MSDNYEIFIRRPFAGIMVSLLESPKYISELARDINVTYSHVARLLDILVELGLVEIEKDGRKTVVKLTEAGYDVAKDVKSILKLFIIEGGLK